MSKNTYTSGTLVRVNYIEDRDVTKEVLAAFEKMKTDGDFLIADEKKRRKIFRTLRDGQEVSLYANVFYILKDELGHAMTEIDPKDITIIEKSGVLYFPENLLDPVEDPD